MTALGDMLLKDVRERIGVLQNETGGALEGGALDEYRTLVWVIKSIEGNERSVRLLEQDLLDALQKLGEHVLKLSAKEFRQHLELAGDVMENYKRWGWLADAIETGRLPEGGSE